MRPVSQDQDVASAEVRSAFWRMLDALCEGSVRKPDAKKRLLLSESVREQNAAAIKLHCSLHPPQSEIAEAVQRLIATASM